MSNDDNSKQSSTGSDVTKDNQQKTNEPVDKLEVKKVVGNIVESLRDIACFLIKLATTCYRKLFAKKRRVSGHSTPKKEGSGVWATLKSPFKANRAYAVMLLGAIVVVILAVVLLIAASRHTSHAPNPVNNLMKINGLQSQLSDIQVNVSSTRKMTTQQQLTIENKLQTIDAKLATLSTTPSKSGGAALEKTLQSKDVDLAQKITALNKQIVKIKAKVFPKKMLNKKVLPFEVVSVDPWNGKPYAEIEQRNNSTMLNYVGLYQVTGGWKVVDISASEQTVTFSNRSGQVVHVALNNF